MMKFRGLKLAAAPVLAALVAAPLLTTACGDDAGGLTGDCAAEISGKVDAFSASVDAMVKASADMKAELYVACANIANDLDAEGAPAADKKDPTDDELKAACDIAAKAIGEAKGSATLELEIIPPRCTVNAEAQVSCEGECYASAECDPGKVEARCEADLSVSCSGSCEGEVLACEGSASVAAKCEGSCQAECTGKCGGVCKGECTGTWKGAEGESECDGDCKGECKGECTGTCSGTCELAANSTFKCEGGTVRCKGECSAEGTAPKCEGTLEPPSCKADAECQASCEGQAKFEATCTEPSVNVNFEGNAELSATLEANYGAVVKVAQKLKLIGEAAGGVASAGGEVLGSVKGSASCAAKYAADFTAKVSAAAKASASVSVSVKASADVNTSAQGSAG
jgi:hypothetical protein